MVTMLILGAFALPLIDVAVAILLIGLIIKLFKWVFKKN